MFAREGASRANTFQKVSFTFTAIGANALYKGISAHPRPKFAFTYQNFKEFKGKMFPHDMCMSFIMGERRASIQFSMNSIKDKSGWDTNSSVSSKYSKVDPEKIFKSLLGN